MRNHLIFLLALALSAFAEIGDLGVIANGTDVNISIAPHSCALTPSTADCGSCTINLPNEIREISLRPVPASEGTSVSGAFEAAFLPVGTNKYTVIVGSSNYAICINRAANGTPSTTNTLSGITINGNPLPGFASETFTYNVAIPYTTSQVTVIATPSSLTSGLEYLNPNANIALDEGETYPAKIRVIAEDANTPNGNYTLNLTRAAGNTNSNLASLDVYLDGDAFYNVLTDFDWAEQNYELNVPHSVAKATIVGVKQEQHFGEYVGQNIYTDVALNVGENEFTITVKPEKGPNKTYKVTIIRASDPDSGNSSSGDDGSSSSGDETSSSSSDDGTSSSSSDEGTSSSSDGGTPVIYKPKNSQFSIYASTNAIILENPPSNAKISVYNLRGEQIPFANPGNPQILRILVPKGIYLVRIGNQTQRIVVQ